jgi:hypothetical protein
MFESKHLNRRGSHCSITGNSPALCRSSDVVGVVSQETPRDGLGWPKGPKRGYAEGRETGLRTKLRWICAAHMDRSGMVLSHANVGWQFWISGEICI